MAIIPEMSVPRRALPILTWLGRLPQEEYDALLAALPGPDDEVTSEDDLATRFREATKGANAEARELLAIVTSLIPLQDDHGWDIDSIVETAAADQALKLDDDQRSKLRRWLQAAATNTSVSRIAKIEDNHDEYQAILHSVRIFTDLRPVFDDEDSNDKPYGMLISHTLKLSYGILEGEREIYLALDGDDLDAVEEAVVHAKKQARELRNLLKSVNISELTPTHH